MESSLVDPVGRRCNAERPAGKTQSNDLATQSSPGFTSRGIALLSSPTSASASWATLESWQQLAPCSAVGSYETNNRWQTLHLRAVQTGVEPKPKDGRSPQAPARLRPLFRGFRAPCWVVVSHAGQVIFLEFSNHLAHMLTRRNSAAQDPP